MEKQASIRLAADIGGTFTDVVLETPTDLYTAKVSTDPTLKVQDPRPSPA